ncbi:hypothetical protein J7I93_06300 [Bacillus sp. ISL-47]|uniref:hypothetical protein n=1 Tax=Bacillus sp. ISL-47 TaxID=2819130 RepID=UPI001BE6DD86|nr:hypothetical protein [Bacillus sp. ISL-47]MBT2687783.1 hypothetical protein [Bacillus sp. ISL-47]MBT2709125.1 hypothetical protein [Pseudomonas sp. ISL-84]
MNQFEKEFNLDSKFPRFNLSNNKKEKMLNEIIRFSGKRTLKKKKTLGDLNRKTANLIAFAASFFLMFGLLFGLLSYQSASLYKDEKVISDISVGMEKAAILIIPDTFERSGIKTSKEAYELLNNYYSGSALGEVLSSWEVLHKKNINYEKDIEGKKIEFAMGSLKEAEEVVIEHLERKKIKVSWYDTIINKKVTLKCNLVDKRWIIDSINIQNK